MFTFFRINDPYRIVAVFFLLVGINLVYLINPPPITVPEIGYMVVGEKLGGNFDLYTDVWDYIGPFSGYFYFLMDLAFGRSHLAYLIVGLLLILFQSALFNFIMLSHKAYNENSYTSALIYALLMSLFYDFIIVSPQLLGMTFVLFALQLLFENIDIRHRKDHRILGIGILVSIASLFYLPYIIFILLILTSFAFFTSFSVRRFLMLVYGFALPFLFVGLYYFWQGGLEQFLVNYIYSYFIIPKQHLIDNLGLMFIYLVPLIMFVLGLLKVINTPSFVNYQNKLQQIMFLMFVLGLAIWFISREKAPAVLMVMIPPVAFYINHFFLLVRRRLVMELVFTVFVVIIVLVNLGTFNNFFFTASQIDKRELLAQPTPYDQLVKNRKIVYLGSNPNVYRQAKLATPYFRWELAKLHLENLDYYDNLTSVFLNFRNDLPEVIIDEQQVIPSLFEKMPTIANNYRQGTKPNVYLLKD